MIRVKNGVQLWLEFEEKNGREPTKQEIINMGFSINYFYKLRKKIDIIKAQEAKDNECQD